mmetsp:Transcript_11549/g.24941  ORF Transcript_11549/g.24941 Transcript_11549/m.24941 type:complete len:240 (-) Transcript_11549:1064-1783(-)
MPASTEWLLPNNRPSAFVVDIEVPRRITEPSAGSFDRIAVFRENRASQSIRACAIDKLNDITPPHVRRIRIDRENRAKDFLFHCFVFWIGRLNDGWLHKVSFRLVVVSSGNDLCLRARFHTRYVRADPVKRSLIDHGGHESVRVVRSTDLQTRELSHEVWLNLLCPHVSRHIHSACCGALLALVFKRASNRAVHHVRWVSSSMNKVEIFSAGLTDNARVAPISRQIAPDRLPKFVKHRS